MDLTGDRPMLAGFFELQPAFANVEYHHCMRSIYLHGNLCRSGGKSELICDKVGRLVYFRYFLFMWIRILSVRLSLSYGFMHSQVYIYQPVPTRLHHVPDEDVVA